jgi:GNAT superfamily N-acetyltransferase
MAAAKVEAATKDDAATCVSVIALAFAADPAARWLYPDPHEFLECFPRFIWAFGGRAFAHGSAYRVGHHAAALWLPPGVEGDDEALLALLEETVPEGRRDRLFEIMQDMASYHPEEPHWYLPLIGTHPAQQGKGCGAALLAHMTAICDRQAMPAFLEATSARSVPLYQRHGFEVLGEISKEGSPALTPMLREPR